MNESGQKVLGSSTGSALPRLAEELITVLIISDLSSDGGISRRKKKYPPYFSLAISPVTILTIHFYNYFQVKCGDFRFSLDSRRKERSSYNQRAQFKMK